ncbi:hypothetical protein E2C01_053451 [Portunus trituberculatus]|uniref:Uncharacterized protein n=1 Tax=Portunus trituberculatus TaxID=210409 RepID=A0A5B7GPD8_PORTR|nr:hypothetical protein [Portunus trituberculatus]
MIHNNFHPPASIHPPEPLYTHPLPQNTISIFYNPYHLHPLTAIYFLNLRETTLNTHSHLSTPNSTYQSIHRILTSPSASLTSPRDPEHNTGSNGPL